MFSSLLVQIDLAVGNLHSVLSFHRNEYTVVVDAGSIDSLAVEEILSFCNILSPNLLVEGSLEFSRGDTRIDGGGHTASLDAKVVENGNSLGSLVLGGKILSLQEIQLREPHNR